MDTRSDFRGAFLRILWPYAAIAGLAAAAMLLGGCKSDGSASPLAVRIQEAAADGAVTPEELTGIQETASRDSGGIDWQTTLGTLLASILAARFVPRKPSAAAQEALEHARAAHDRLNKTPPG